MAITTSITVSTGAVIAMIAATVASTAAAITSAAIQAQQQNAQIKYQQEVQRQNAIAAQNKAAAEAKERRMRVAKVQAAARAKMAASGVDSTSGSFLDLLGQGAAHGEMDVLKAKFDGDASAWAINTKIGELETQKQNVALNASIAGIGAFADSMGKYGGSLFGGSGGDGISWGKADSGGKIGTSTNAAGAEVIHAPLSSGIS